MNAIPTKHDKGVQPIYTQIEVLKHPVFLIQDAPEDFVGKLPVKGDVRVEVSAPKLGTKEADVFHAIINLGKVINFSNPDITFISRQLLSLMNWPKTGKYYKRLGEAIDNLTDIKLRIIGGDSFEHYDRFFYKATLWKNTDGHSELSYRSSITMGEPLLRMCRKGHLKGMHPYYYTLKTFSIAKRLFTLISVNASDLKTWKIDLYNLRDLIPLIGKKYNTISGIKQTILPSLKRFIDDGIIHSYDYQPSPHKRAILTISINNDYFYSKTFPIKTITVPPTTPNIQVSDITIKEVRPKQTDPLIEELTKRQVSENIGKKLVRDFDKKHIQARIEYYDSRCELAKQGKLSEQQAPHGPGFLVDSIKAPYPLPDNFKTKAELQEETLKATLLNEAEQHLRIGEHKLAIEKTGKLLELGQSNEATQIKTDAEKSLQRQEEEAAVARYVESLTPEQVEALHERTRAKINRHSKRTIESVKGDDANSPYYNSTFKQVALESYLMAQGNAIRQAT